MLKFDLLMQEHVVLDHAKEVNDNILMDYDKVMQ